MHTRSLEDVYSFVSHSVPSSQVLTGWQAPGPDEDLNVNGGQGAHMRSEERVGATDISKPAAQSATGWHGLVFDAMPNVLPRTQSLHTRFDDDVGATVSPLPAGQVDGVLQDTWPIASWY